MHYTKYITQAKLHADKLRSLLGNYHPRSATYAKTYKRPEPLPITAPGAEAACRVVRNKIAKEDSLEPHPIAVFNIALETGNLEAAQEINNLLNSAWFGVPESTSCWQIPGFKEAVALMEDSPDYDGPESAEETAAANPMKYYVELVWNRESHFVGYGNPHDTLDLAIKAAQDIENSGDGGRVKKTRVVDDNGKTVWAYGKLV